MEVKILNEVNNPLFNRKEVRFEIVHESKETPKLIEAKRVLASKTGSDGSHIIIDGFKTLFGIGRTIGDARIYKNMNELKDYEPMYLQKRNGLIVEEKKEEPKPEEKPAEKKEEEAKKEDNKEEVKPEEKEGE